MVDVTEEMIFTGSNPTVDRQTRRLGGIARVGAGAWSSVRIFATGADHRRTSRDT